MKESYYKSAFRKSPMGYAYHKIILDDSGRPCDYEFVEANSVFIMLSGLKAKDIVGLKISELLPHIAEFTYDRLKIYGDIALYGGEKEFDIYSEPLKKWYRVNVYSPEKGSFASHFVDVSKEKKEQLLLEQMGIYSEELLEAVDEILDYQKITENILELSEAKFASFNLYDEDGQHFTTMTVAGDREMIKKVYKMLGYEIEGRVWDHDAVRNEKIKDSIVTRFTSFGAIADTSIPRSESDLAAQMLGLGQAIIIKIMKNNVMLGDFTCVMAKGTFFDNDMVVELYTRQIGLAIVRQRTEAKLQEEQRITEAIYNSVPGYLYMYDRSGKMIRWNKKHEEMTGYTAEELSRMTLDDWFKGDDAVRVAAAVKDVFTNGYAEIEADLHINHGKTIPILTNGIPLTLGDQTYFVGIGIDITERKKAEQVQLEREQYFRTILETTQDGFWVLDNHGCITDVNESYCRMSGYKREELLKMKIQELDGKESANEIASHIHRVLGFGPEIFETSHTRKDGSVFDVEISVTPVLRNTGVVLVCFCRDITERNLAEASLEKSEEKHRRLFETMSQGIVYQSAEGEIISANPAAERILGMSLDQMQGLTSMSPSWNTIREDGSTIPGSMHPAMISLRTGKPAGPCIMGVFQPQINDHIWLRVNAIPLFREGEATPYQVYATLQDITAERKANQNYQLLFREMVDGFALHEIICDEQGTPVNYRYIAVNPAFEQITGLRAADIIGKTVLDVLPETESFWIEAYGRVALTGEAAKFSRYTSSIDKYFEVSAYQTAPNQFACTFSDITVKKRGEETLLYQSNHDYLTGLYNRRFFEEEVKRLDTARNLPITIIMGDVNGLKLINDSFGHATGDELLKRTAEVIRQECRSDDIIARLGGDEFVIILTRTDAVIAEQIVDRLTARAMDEKIGSIEMSISFGYETKQKPEESIQEILTGAENQMYRRKLYKSSSMRSKTVDLIMKTLFEKSNREMMHSKRVSEFCEQIAGYVYSDSDTISRIKTAGLMHDIGKIGIEENILNKTDRLNNDEWKEMKKHPEIGWRILSSADEFSELANFILEHQERWDGRGYPNGLKGEEISMAARIIALADSYDAMTSERSYRKALSGEEAVIEIKKCSGTQFDPDIAIIFLEKVLGVPW